MPQLPNLANQKTLLCFLPVNHFHKTAHVRDAGSCLVFDVDRSS